MDDDDLLKSLVDDLTDDSEIDDEPKRPIQIQPEVGESQQHSLARTALNPLVLSALTVSEYAPLPVNADLNTLVTALEDQADSIKDGNLDRIEEMLVAQAHTLDAIANHLFRRVLSADTMPKFETYMKYGLRAQSQCRANAEALANMKNPKTHLNQTNIGYNQQVNNELEKENPPIELLEKTDGERLDFGTAATPIRGDQDLEALAKQHRAKDAGG